MHYVIWGLISVDQTTGKAITTGMFFRSISNMLASLCKVKLTDPVALKEFEDIVERMKVINEKRNQIIHSFWVEDAGNKVSSRIKFKADRSNEIKTNITDTSSEEIKNLADEIRILSKDTLDLATKYQII